MELKRIKCPSCGGELDIFEDSDEMECSFCGSKVIIDDKATEIGRIKKAEIKAKKELDEYELENKKNKIIIMMNGNIKIKKIQVN